MGMFKKEDDYVELDHVDNTEIKKVPIHIEKLNEYSDSDRIQRKLREGTVMLVRVKELKDKNMAELKRAIERIKKTCEAVNGDIVGVGDEWIIVSPANAKVERA